MPVYGFNERSTAETLKQIARERRGVASYATYPHTLPTGKRILLGKAPEAIEEGESGTVDLYGAEDFESKGEETATGKSVEVFARSRIEANEFILISWIDTGYEVVGGLSCPDRNEVWHCVVLGPPDGGSFDMRIRIPTDSGDVVEDVTIPWNANHNDFGTALATHSQIEGGDVAPTGILLPGGAIRIEFTGRLAGLRIHVPVTDHSGLEGDGPLGVIVFSVQDGFPHSTVEALGS